ncbi:hypothetical protein F5890DRAFT_670433 [Lentinula detonsa]|uniref:Uncharacterized protein n=1 Tax=Lentinula detonsa TaxID=2804962 RepID=A0AA38PRV1_9AGAR|nr:hypothetical protein F5890DRAFT_670433 [Lentinula detonsa]
MGEIKNVDLGTSKRTLYVLGHTYRIVGRISRADFERTRGVTSSDTRITPSEFRGTTLQTQFHWGTEYFRTSTTLFDSELTFLLSTTTRNPGEACWISSSYYIIDLRLLFPTLPLRVSAIENGVHIPLAPNPFLVCSRQGLALRIYACIYYLFLLCVPALSRWWNDVTKEGWCYGRFT